MARGGFSIHYSHRRAQRSTGVADGRAQRSAGVADERSAETGRETKEGGYCDRGWARSAAGGFLPVEVVGESIDGAGVDSQIRRLTIAGDAYAGAGADMGVAVDGDGGGVGGRDAGVSGGVDVAVAVREDDGVLVCPYVGVIGSDDAAFPVCVDGGGVEGFDVGEVVRAHAGVVGGLEEASAGGGDGSAGDGGAGLSGDGDVDAVGNVSEFEPVVGAGVDDQCGGAGIQVAGVFVVAVDDCGAGALGMVPDAAAYEVVDGCVHESILPVSVELRVILGWGVRSRCDYIIATVEIPTRRTFANWQVLGPKKFNMCGCGALWGFRWVAVDLPARYH